MFTCSGTLARSRHARARLAGSADVAGISRGQEDNSLWVLLWWWWRAEAEGRAGTPLCPRSLRLWKPPDVRVSLCFPCQTRSWHSGLSHRPFARLGVELHPSTGREAHSAVRTAVGVDETLGAQRGRVRWPVLCAHVYGAELSWVAREVRGGCRVGRLP